MKIEQNPKFQPITITLETKEEADLFWGVLYAALPEQADQNERQRAVNEFTRTLSNWFSNEAQYATAKMIQRWREINSRNESDVE